MPPPNDKDVCSGTRPAAAGRAELTPRQRQVLRLIAEGCSTKEIGRRLHMSVKTVEFHRANLRRRLGCTSTAELTRFAVRAGLVEL